MSDARLERLRKLDFKSKAELSYDPDDVNIRLQSFRVFELIEMIDKNSLDILIDDFEYFIESEDYQDKQMSLKDEESMDIEGEDDLQRNAGLWNNIQKSRFIESLMIKLPIPLFYFDGSRKPWRVVDGLQRLNTLMDFITGSFALTDLEYLKKECEGLRINNGFFPGHLKRRIFDTEVIAYVINPGTPPDVKYNIFKRINTGGLKLNGQEIRNAFFRGGPAELTKELAKSESFKKATQGKISPKRMVDREYTNRFIAFQLFDYHDYNGKMDLFLSQAMSALYEANNEDFATIRSSFHLSMTRTNLLFDHMGFRRPKGGSELGRAPNKALFDTLSWNLTQISDSDFQYLLDNKNSFRENFYDFLNYNELMYKSINDTTGNKSAVRTRFTLLQNFINKFIND